MTIIDKQGAVHIFRSFMAQLKFWCLIRQQNVGLNHPNVGSVPRPAPPHPLPHTLPFETLDPPWIPTLDLSP